LPSTGNALERDPYLIRTLIARIQFEFETHSVTENGVKSQDESRFKQRYSLDTRGNLLSRYLIIYDAGASFSNNDYKSGPSNFVTDEYDLNLRTTLLPKSAIPLTFYGDYNNQKLSGLPNPYKHSRLTYGLNWFSTLKVLPKTMLTIERVNDKTATTDTLSTYVRAKLEKDIGPTENQLEYVYQNNDDQKSAGYGNSNSLNLTNLTHLSRHTVMTFGATRSETKDANDIGAQELQTTKTTLQGLAMSLSSRPSQEFNQTHNYSFYSNKSTGTNTGSTYAGDLNYGFSDRLKSHVGLTFSEDKSETGTSQSKNQTISTSDSINYALTGNLTISEQISFAKTTTNASEGTAANVGGRSNLKLTTAISYRTTLSFGKLYTNYSLSYLEDNTTKNKGGKGIEQFISAGLSGVELIPHVGMRTSARYSAIKNLSGDIGGRSYGYNAAFYNRSLRKYVNILALYDKDTTDSWIDVLEQRRELYRLSLSSEYFRNTTLKANADLTHNFNAISGFTTTTSQDISVGHIRRFLGGSLSLAATLSHATNISSGQDQRVLTKYYEAKYSRPFIRTVLWQLQMMRNERTDQATFVNVTTISNGLFLPLRSWLFSLEHDYSLTNDDRRERSENRLMLRASRSFFRVY